MLKPLLATLSWMLNLFDPPPLKSMTLAQKFSRVVLLSGTLVIGSILVAMLGALGLYLMERGRELQDTPEFYKGIVIILTGIVVNTFCVLILVQIKRVDHRIIPPTTPDTPLNLKITPEQLTGTKEKPKPTH